MRLNSQNRKLLSKIFSMVIIFFKHNSEKIKENKRENRVESIQISFIRN